MLAVRVPAVEVAKFTVMSYNARMDTTEPSGSDGSDGPNAWPHRRELLAVSGLTLIVPSGSAPPASAASLVLLHPICIVRRRPPGT